MTNGFLQDVQFYREASDVQFDETGNRKRKYRYGDEDEIELEQQERKRRQALNKEFKHFAERIAEASTSSVRSNATAYRGAALIIVRRETLSKQTFRSGNFRSKSSHSGQTSNSNRLPNVLFISRIHHSWLLLLGKSRSHPWNVYNSD